ncbi:MAG: hypothetical protein FJ134_12175 [Deltaproteobacteria bacterium]|nr:hypothetical protein [Deltaproteobacteria bacterium]
MNPFVSLPSLLVSLVLVLSPLAAIAQGGVIDTHMGKHTGKHVHLVYRSGVGYNSIFQRVRLDGRIETANFTVPAGQVLVVTDVSWGRAAYSSTGSTAMLNLETYYGAAVVSLVFNSTLKLDENGIAAKHETLTSGILVGPNGSFGLSDTSYNPQFANIVAPTWVVLRGYLVLQRN